MSAQGSNIIDIDYIKNLTKAAENIETCDELRALSAEALASISDAQAAIALELAKVQPMLALLVAPGANLAKLATFAQDLITNLITPLVKPSVTYAAQLTAMLAQVAELTAAIQAAADRIGECSI